ncbi:MAG: hypothetical protein R3212_09075, partial [Xanthomonadales bacterium]|nr:hypothetical protein [Xanthomonadales bacterium]
GYELMRMGEYDRALGLLEEAEERQFELPRVVTRAWFDAMHDESKWPDFVALADQLIAEGTTTEAMILNGLVYTPVVDEYFERAHRHIDDRQLLVRILWRNSARDLRVDPRFEELVTHLNVLPYWEKYGWADVCAPTEDGFDCHP